MKPGLKLKTSLCCRNIQWSMAHEKHSLSTALTTMWNSFCPFASRILIVVSQEAVPLRTRANGRPRESSLRYAFHLARPHLRNLETPQPMEDDTYIKRSIFVIFHRNTPFDNRHGPVGEMNIGLRSSQQ